MENVYDLVAFFYDNDEEWNTVLQRGTTESFLRREAWSGRDDEELKQEWSQVMMLCLYLAHSNCQLGDLSADDVIDAVAWCGRNINEFVLDYEHVKYFLEVLGRLFVFLKEKKDIMSSVAPQFAKEKLLRDDGTLAIIDNKGEFLPGEYRREKLAVPDAPVKIFLNIGESMEKLLQEMQVFFKKHSFEQDLHRALFLYHGLLSLDEELPEDEENELWQCFWEYFFFDYHLLRDDVTPLQHFLWYGNSDSRELLKEFAEVRLIAFEVKEMHDDGLYACKDFLTDEEYVLSLPLNEVEELKDTLLVGHIFYNNSMVMNHIRFLKTNKIIRKRLRELLKKCYNRYKIQEPLSSVQDFVARNAVLVTRLIYSSGLYLPSDSVLESTAVVDYQPLSPEAVKDEVTARIADIMQRQCFSRRDIILTGRMWYDFCQKDCETLHKHTEEWALGVIGSYIALNGVYSCTEQDILDMGYGVLLGVFQKAKARIDEVLHIEWHDPRYTNEEGFIMLAFVK